MGSCVAMHSKPPKQYRKQMRKPPQDIRFYLPGLNSDLQTHRFEGSVTNVRIQGEINEPIGIIFQISERRMRVEFPLASPQQTDKTNLKWKIREEKFKFTANEYEIRYQTLEIKIFSKNNQTIETIEINLYKVLTGPIKNKFAITLKNNHHLTLYYDLQISQVLKMQTKIKSTKMELKSQHRGQMFNFTIQSNITENGKKSRRFQTRPSPSKSATKTPQNLMQQLNDDLEQPVSIGKIKRRTSLQNNEQKFVLEWKEQQNLPEITFHLTVNEINSSLFLFHCWKVGKASQNQEKQVLHRFANFRMTLCEFFQLRKVFQDNIQKKIIIPLSQPIWSHGVQVGHCKCEIQVSVPQYVKQLTGLIRTEKGVIDKGMQDFQYERDSFSQKSQNKIKHIHQKLLSLKNQMIEKLPIYFRKKEMIKQATEILTQLNKQIKVVNFNQQKFFQDPGEVNELLERQLEMLHIFNTIYSLLSWEDYNLNQKCWQLIVLLIKRPEFQLRCISFSEKQVSLLQKSFDTVNKNGRKVTYQRQQGQLHKKVKIGIEFHRLLIDCLIESLNSGISMIDENFNQFPSCQIFKGQCLIRIPVFRDFLLKEISQTKDAAYSHFQIKERQWLKSKIQMKEIQTQLCDQIQWDKHFNTPLNFFIQGKQKEEELIDVLKDCVWIEEMAVRDSFFFRFLRIVMQNYNEFQSKFKVPKYQYFSGYNKLVTAFLNEMRNRPLSAYSQTLIMSSMSLLQNQDLQQPILLLLAQKTNYYDYQAVLKCLSIIRLYVNYLTKENKQLPVSFCYGVFVQIIKKILMSESQNCVAAILLIMYEAYQNLDPEFQSYITHYFLGSQFLPLFYHWSYVVRSIFHHFFILKIAQNKSIFKPLLKAQRRLKISYENVLNELEENQRKILHKNLVKNVTQVKLQYFHRMKRKLIRKIRQKQGDYDGDFGKNEIFDHSPLIIQKIKSSIVNDDAKQIQSSNVSAKWLTIFDLKRKQQLFTSGEQNSPTGKQMWIRSRTLIYDDEGMKFGINGLKLKKQYTYHESAKYNDAFIESEFMLSQMKLVQQNQIWISHKQFEKINSEITVNFVETKQLPSLPEQTYSFFHYGDLQMQTTQSNQFD